MLPEKLKEDESCGRVFIHLTSGDDSWCRIVEINLMQPEQEIAVTEQGRRILLVNRKLIIEKKKDLTQILARNVMKIFERSCGTVEEAISISQLGENFACLL